MKKRGLIDLTGAPFIVEQREDGKWYIVGVKLRKRELIFESTGLPVDIVERLEGVAGDGKVSGLREVEDFLEGIPEGSRLEESVPEEYVSDGEITSAWEDALAAAKARAGIGEE